MRIQKAKGVLMVMLLLALVGSAVLLGCKKSDSQKSDTTKQLEEQKDEVMEEFE